MDEFGAGHTRITMLEFQARLAIGRYFDHFNSSSIAAFASDDMKSVAPGSVLFIQPVISDNLQVFWKI